MEAKVEQFKEELEEKEKQLKHAESEWERTSKIVEEVRGLLAKAKVKQDKRANDLAKAKHNMEGLEYKLKEHRSKLKELTGDIQRLRDSFVSSRKRSELHNPASKQIWRAKER